MAKVKKEMAQGFASGELWDVLSDLVDDLNALRTLVNDLRAKYEAHRVQTGAHSTNDTTNTISAPAVTLKTTK
ncbi:MAG: hypothetical protein ACPLQO_02230 [Desulfotomaculales bacterium]